MFQKSLVKSGCVSVFILRSVVFQKSEAEWGNSHSKAEEKENAS